MARSEVRVPEEPPQSDVTGDADKTTTSERRTPRTGGRPRRGGRVTDPEAEGTKQDKPKPRGSRRATTGRGSTDDRDRGTTSLSGARGPATSKGEEAAPETPNPSQPRPSRETQASGAFIAKRAEPETDKAGIFKRMSAALTRAVRGEDEDEE